MLLVAKLSQEDGRVAAPSGALCHGITAVWPTADARVLGESPDRCSVDIPLASPLELTQGKPVLKHDGFRA